MKKITVEELKELLELHTKWLNDNSKGQRLDLSYRDLTDLGVVKILANADLRFANLNHANLSNAILPGVENI